MYLALCLPLEMYTETKHLKVIIKENQVMSTSTVTSRPILRDSTKKIFLKRRENTALLQQISTT